MKGEKTFGVRTEGIYPSRVKGYGPVINIDRYPGSDRRKRGKHEIRYRKKIIEKEFPDEKIPSILMDLLNIALATFYADTMVERDIKLNAKRVESRYNSRKIKLVVPVSHKERWKSVKEKLERTISFMTYDVFKYKFITRKSDSVKVSSKEDEHDSVALFSGGLDSLGGSYYLREEGYNPCFVSINHTNIDPILSRLREVLPENSLKEIRVDKSLRTEEYTQFSRSFVYLSFATVIAVAHGINKIFIPENGIIARQIGLHEGRLSTRTAHPQFLRYFNELANEILPQKGISVENPFTYKTKTEIVGEIEDKNKIGKAVSCAHRLFLSPKYTEANEPVHCGMGVPCLIRTIALIADDVRNKEELLNVHFNPFMIDFNNPDMRKNVPNPDLPIKRGYRDGLVNLMDIAKLAFEIDRMPYQNLISKYPDFLDYQVYDLYKKFSKNTLKTIDYFRRVNESLGELINNFKS